MARRFQTHRAPTPKTVTPVAMQAAAGVPPRATENNARPAAMPDRRPSEIGGPDGPEPTRYGDWERKGICVDF